MIKKCPQCSSNLTLIIAWPKEHRDYGPGVVRQYGCENGHAHVEVKYEMIGSEVYAEEE